MEKREPEWEIVEPEQGAPFDASLWEPLPVPTSEQVDAVRAVIDAAHLELARSLCGASVHTEGHGQSYASAMVMREMRLAMVRGS